MLKDGNDVLAKPRLIVTAKAGTKQSDLATGIQGGLDFNIQR